MGGRGKNMASRIFVYQALNTTEIKKIELFSDKTG